METLAEVVKSNEVFAQAYSRFMKEQIAASTGERKRKLMDEGNMQKFCFCFMCGGLLPGIFGVYMRNEIRDFKDGWRYLDFAYITSTVRICIEIDPYGTHSHQARNGRSSNHRVEDRYAVADCRRICSDRHSEYLKSLVDKGLIMPIVSATGMIMRYRLLKSRQ